MILLLVYTHIRIIFRRIKLFKIIDLNNIHLGENSKTLDNTPLWCVRYFSFIFIIHIHSRDHDLLMLQYKVVAQGRIVHHKMDIFYEA